MDSILKHMTEKLELILDDFSEGDEERQDKVSMWVKDKDYFVPSTDISVIKELPPGMYQVNYSNERGFYCKPIKIETDELFIFTDAITTELLEEIQLFWDKADIYKDKNFVHKRGILLSGFAGTGKTTLINMVSQELIKRGGVVFKVYGIKNLSN